MTSRNQNDAPSQQLCDSKPATLNKLLLYHHHAKFRHGDTLVLIDMPPSSKPPRDCLGVPWSSIHLRMSSEKIHAAESPVLSKKMKEFGLRGSRMAKSRNISLEEIQGVKWLLNLTPDHEGEDMPFQMAEMSLTPGLIDWWRMMPPLTMHVAAIMGHDDVCTCWRPPTPEPPLNEPLNEGAEGAEEGREEAEEEEEEGGGGGDGGQSEEHEGRKKEKEKGVEEEKRTEAKAVTKEARFRQIPDYCPIRHRVAILRLLYIIEGEGKDIVLDSAPQVWTLVAIAKIFECESQVRGHVMEWLLESGNRAFPQALPEESLRLGSTLQLAEMTRRAFSVLVNEKALEGAARTQQPGASRRKTLFDRRCQDPGDDWNNVIEHAARAMVERIFAFVKSLSAESIFDDLEVTEWSRLRKLERLLGPEAEAGDPVCVEALGQTKDLMFSLREHWGVAIVDRHLSSGVSEYTSNNLLRPDPSDYSPGPANFTSVYNDFNPVQRALCSVFYQDIAQKWNECPFGLSTSKRTRHDAKYSLYWNKTQALWKVLERVMEKRRDLAETAEWEEVFDKVSWCPYFSLSNFISELERALEFRIFALPHGIYKSPFLKSIRPLLLNLTDNEFKYLPLWAGGNDDGTGGVFEEMPPPADFGPAGPGPAYHTGHTIPSDTTSVGSSVIADMGGMALSSRGTTVGPDSMDPQGDYASTVYNPKRVIADDVSIQSETFTEGGFEYADAKYAAPAEGTTRNADTSVQPVQDPKGKGKQMDDDRYDDDDDDISMDAFSASDDDDFEMVY